MKDSEWIIQLCCNGWERLLGFIIIASELTISSLTMDFPVGLLPFWKVAYPWVQRFLWYFVKNICQVGAANSTGGKSIWLMMSPRQHTPKPMGIYDVFQVPNVHT